MNLRRELQTFAKLGPRPRDEEPRTESSWTSGFPTEPLEQRLGGESIPVLLTQNVELDAYGRNVVRAERSDERCDLPGCSDRLHAWRQPASATPSPSWSGCRWLRSPKGERAHPSPWLRRGNHHWRWTRECRSGERRLGVHSFERTPYRPPSPMRPSQATSRARRRVQERDVVVDAPRR